MRTHFATEVASLKNELSALTKRERSKRSGLQKQINSKEAEASAARESKELLDGYYGDASGQ